MTKADLMKLVGKKIFVYFKDGGSIYGTLGYVDEFSAKYDYRKPNFFYKGDKERTVFLNANAKYTLTEYLNSRVDNDDALFVSSRKPYKPMGKTGIEAVIRKIGERCLDRPVFCHLLRHTCATILVQHGMPIEQVQYILGHSSLDTTMIYAKTSKEQTKYNFNMSFV